MEYLAHRLGIVFVKISGPAIGPRVTSLDPAEAPNAAAREELRKLNFAFALGDNLMLCLDDIQHLHPEFLQKFIPLCDAQRQIEGVYEGQARTFDLRGKQVAVVMAGNPYTESGERFRLPDMLANRADTYNLGDVLAGHEAAFHLSYLENASGSNPLLARLLARHPQDLHPLLQLAGSGSREGLEFAGSYSPEELADAVSVLRKLTRIRDIVLRVNAEYIRSASQAEAYRTEPPFHLQGSYRNMNRLAEQVAPLMNDAELETLLQNHYRNEAQTLSKGAESNLPPSSVNSPAPSRPTKPRAGRTSNAPSAATCSSTRPTIRTPSAASSVSSRPSPTASKTSKTSWPTDSANSRARWPRRHLRLPRHPCPRRRL
ncbi:MAG: hypothetical protein M5U12_02655 [Verrucomicrobia bacterium]|nr:hypothetical protein [Verrucomicrobiota bacterium]